MRRRMIMMMSPQSPMENGREIPPLEVTSGSLWSSRVTSKNQKVASEDYAECNFVKHDVGQQWRHCFTSWGFITTIWSVKTFVSVSSMPCYIMPCHAMPCHAIPCQKKATLLYHTLPPPPMQPSHHPLITCWTFLLRWMSLKWYSSLKKKRVSNVFQCWWGQQQTLSMVITSKDDHLMSR